MSAASSLIRPSSDAGSLAPIRLTTVAKGGSADWRSYYTPAQIEQHERLKAIRRKTQDAIAARLQRQRDAEAEAVAAREAEAARRKVEARQRLEAAIEVARKEAKLPVPVTIEKTGLSVSRMRQTVRLVAEHYGMEPDDILVRGRVRIATTARAHAMSILARDNIAISMAGIGRAFGLDHTTVIHAIRRYNSAFNLNVRGLGPTVRTREPFLPPLFRPIDDAEREAMQPGANYHGWGG